MFFLEVAEIAGTDLRRQGGRGSRAAQQEARRYATRLDTHAFLKQLASPHSGAVELYRRNYLALLEDGQVAERGLLPLAGYRARGGAGVPAGARACGRPGIRPGGRTAYAVEKTAIQIRDLPGG